MAFTWQQAQEREKQFWEEIYIENRGDIPTYRPITDANALAFSSKSLERFGLHFKDIDNKIIADVGCGPYGLIKGIDVRARASGVSPRAVYGIDPLMETYKKFRTLPFEKYITLITSKGESIPLPDDTCDYVFSINVVDHVEVPDGFMRECRRICSPGGMCLFALHVLRVPFTLAGPALYIIDKNHPHHFTLDNILRLARTHFREGELVRKVTMIEDQVDFTFGAIFQSTNQLRAMKRWLSTYVLETAYVRCIK